LAPRGPVFQGFEDNGEGYINIYTSWYNQGANVPPGSPVIAIGQPVAQIYLHSDTITLNYAVGAGTGSRVQSFTLKMDGQTTLIDGTNLVNGQTINLLTKLTIGEHTFSIDAVNNFGNPTTKSVKFAIVVTDASIGNDVTQFVATGKITQNEGKSLLSKLVTAAKARAKGNCPNAITIYMSFISEVQAQSGKTIDQTAALILIADARYLIAHCP